MKERAAKANQQEEDRNLDEDISNHEKSTTDNIHQENHEGDISVVHEEASSSVPMIAENNNIKGQTGKAKATEEKKETKSKKKAATEAKRKDQEKKKKKNKKRKEARNLKIKNIISFKEPMEKQNEKREMTTAWPEQNKLKEASKNRIMREYKGTASQMRRAKRKKQKNMK
ncbi:vicilin-like seed storage protein At2g18540 [Lycium barbarum]|uniref:vicilin-like seed storage protein At2g18540 n=1 Tax=Lycium barbarum TaxID=112863 RepID=UPI00293E889E|nr:vicilin-like seed storage protein At2g18540 [Lycium barbarum]